MFFIDKNYLKISQFKEQALLSKKLAQLNYDAPFEIKDTSDYYSREVSTEISPLIMD